MFTVQVDDRQVREALRRLAGAAGNLDAPLKLIGERLVESTKRRFETSTAPDGSRWAPNTEATYLRYLATFRGSYTKKGRLSASGAKRAAGKRPLIGETGSLSRTIAWQLLPGGLVIGSPMEYAATQQFGAERGRFGRTRRGSPIPWGDIPARPFLGLSDEDSAAVLDIVQDHLSGTLGR